MKNLQIIFAFFFLLAGWSLPIGAVAQAAEEDLSGNVINHPCSLAGILERPALGENYRQSNLPDAEYWYPTSPVPALNPIPILQKTPEGFRLEQNYPNPFRLMTTIEFELPKPAAVTLSLLDLAGREVLTLMDENRDAGIHQVSFAAIDLAGGLYLYRLVVRDPSSDFRKVFVASKKLMLLQ